MRIGFISDGSEEHLRFAAEHGFASVEFDWYTGWEEQASPAGRKAQRALLDKHGVDLQAVGLWGRNHLDPDPAVRARNHDDLKAILDYAEALGTPVVMTSTGVMEGRPLKEQADEFARAFEPLVAHAEKRKVKLAFYNCHQQTFALAPEGWELIFARFPETGIKYDPSHAVYDGRDYLSELAAWGHQVVHVHGKDMQYVNGKLFEQPPCGLGDLRWGAILSLLHHHGYRGDIALEPHSQTWMGERWGAGLLLGKRHLEQFMA